MSEEEITHDLICWSLCCSDKTEEIIEQVENSVMLDEFSPRPNNKIAVVFGNEVKGVQQEVVSAADYCVEIPQKGTKHSLNISVSCGVVLWDLFQKLQ